MMPDQKVVTKLFAGRATAANTTRAMSRGILAPPIVWADIGTMAVDKHSRMYVSPDVVEKWTLKQIAGVIVHEALHIMLGHCDRGEALSRGGGDGFDAQVWNVAVDIVVNHIVLAMDLTLPDGHVLGSQYGIDPELPAETIYRKLMENAESDPQGGSGDGDGEGESGDGNGQGKSKEADDNSSRGGFGGSCADGKPREYEVGTDEKDAKAMTPGEQRAVAKDMAQKMAAESASGRGIGSADMARAIEDLTQPPKVLWDDMLRGTIIMTAQRVTGSTHMSYHRPHRFSSLPGWGDVPRPVTTDYLPKVAVVMDESGSMGEGSGSRRERAHTELRGVLDHVQCMVRLLSFDSSVYDTGWIDNIFDAVVRGGGGTDVRIPMRYVEDELIGPDKCDIVIVCTDCDSPWPDVEPPFRCIVVDVSERKSGNVPEWADHVHVELD